MARPSMHVELVDTLGARIATGELAEGTVINIGMLEEEFAVSRTVAREAMRLLESLGLIEARRRVGLIVTHPSQWDVLSPRVIAWRLSGNSKAEQLRSLTDLRIAIEPIAASRAAVRASDAQRNRLIELAAELRRLGDEGRGDSDDYVTVDTEFHHTILEASGNEMFLAMKDAVAAVLEGRRRLGRSPRYPIRHALDLHTRIADAISSGDYELAEATSRQQVTLVRREID
ncbi:MAG TPA: FadR family transcriptional regulator [Actinomycetales bacterium]|nr:FadR family transcriptional regulator [Actinomycetales bacterium]